MGLRPQSRPEAEGQTAQALHRPYIKLEGARWEDSRPRLQVQHMTKASGVPKSAFGNLKSSLNHTLNVNTKPG
jgi:hypothetical protein